jgi:enamine deaminase RidA (YjgF/YER057c/UK114 family)
MKREIIRVEPLATYLERWKAPTSTVVKHGNTLYVTGAPPYEPETREIFGGDIRRQAEQKRRDEILADYHLRLGVAKRSLRFRSRW